MTDRTSILPVLVVAALTAIASAARAELITPTAAAASSANLDAPVTNAINGAGLSVNSAAGTHDNPLGHAGMWLTVSGNGLTVSNEWAMFDLGMVYDLSQTYIWNFNQSHPVNSNGTRNVRTMNVYVTAGSTNWTQVGGTRTLDIVDGSNAALPAEVESLSATGVRYVLFDLLTAGSGNADEWCGLSEVRFEGTLVPAPVSYPAELPLSNAVGGASIGGFATNLLTDTFNYDPYFPGFGQPVHSHGAGFSRHGFLSSNSDAENYWYAQVTTGGKPLDYIDVWGNDVAGWSSQVGRFQGLTLSFYTSTNATSGLIATYAAWDGVVYNGDRETFRPTHGRLDVAALIPNATTRTTIQSIKIDHAGKTQYLELFEVRAAYAGGPLPPSGTVIILQ